MAAFLFQLELPELTEEIAATIPVHRAHINQLFARGSILSYSVSLGRTVIWCVINSDEESAAMEMILEFPLYPFFTEILCHPLLFHNTLPVTLPGIFLN